MPGALRPSLDLSQKSNVIPSINRRTEATAEDFKELSDIANNHANILDELTQAENRNLFYGIFGSKELLEASFENVQEDGIAIIDPPVGQQTIAKYKNGAWTYQEVTAPIQFYLTKLNRPANGETGIWYIVLDEKKAYLWYGGGWIGIGTDGQNGISAYQIAVAFGFEGTEPEWLESLKKGFKDSVIPASEKATPVNTDLFGILDSAASFITKKLTWSNLKAALKTYFDTIYAPIGSGGNTYTPPIDYATVQEMLDNQVDQQVGYEYTVEDASGWSTIEHNGWAKFQKKATSTASESDYIPRAQEDFDSVPITDVKDSNGDSLVDENGVVRLSSDYFWTIYQDGSESILSNSITLQDEGDSLEFETICEDFANEAGDFFSLGLFGESGSSTTIIGFYYGQLRVKDSSGNWTTQTGFNEAISEGELVRVKLVYTDTGIDIFKNDTYQKSIPTAVLIIDKIGKAYKNTYSYNGKLRDVTIISSGVTTNMPTPYLSNSVKNSNVLLDVSGKNINEKYPVYYDFTYAGGTNQSFNIYVRYIDNTNLFSDDYFIRFNLLRYNLSGKYSDQYRIYDAQLYRLVDGVMVNQNISLLATGESEFTYITDGKSDFTGGVHGDEQTVEAKFYASGIELTNLDNDIALTPCSDFYYTQLSTTHTTDDETHPIEANHYKRTKFSNSGYHTRNRLVFQKTVPLVFVYAGISCIGKSNASVVHNEYFESDDFVGGNSSKLVATGRSEYYGSNPTTGLTAEVKAKVIRPEPIFYGDVEMRVEDRTNDTKYYLKYTPTTTPVNSGDVIESEMTVKFGKDVR